MRHLRTMLGVASLLCFVCLLTSCGELVEIEYADDVVFRTHGGRFDQLHMTGAYVPAGGSPLTFDLVVDGTTFAATDLQTLSSTPPGGNRKTSVTPEGFFTDIVWIFPSNNSVRAVYFGNDLSLLWVNSGKAGSVSLDFHRGVRVELPIARRDLDAALGVPLRVGTWGL
ncbi:hypothetical protein PSMK_19970 [Phycisphaera mikurensis NBRC 102666]|uniref:Lipoprotein n=1 Tax=Phycisphaera mikurensis (strain NBRC 102666 / KCTC 22515 / FYK2301M01) TaxID=1142394 RepID=I0IFW8_PHYMF|nr:hypothetical protein PSMK_19970 [Phycisphaera mikurensis NBRC 102666]